MNEEAPRPLSFPGINLTPEALVLRARCDRIQDQLNDVVATMSHIPTESPSHALGVRARDELKRQIAAIERQIVTV